MGVIFKAGAFEHFLRMGSFAEKKVVTDCKNSFDALIVNANLVEAAPAAAASWLGGEMKDKPYLIDPITYAFALHPKHIKSEHKVKKTDRRELQMKRTFRRLSERYGQFTRKIAGERRITTDDVGKPEILKELAANVVDYQIGRFAEELKKDAKYGLDVAEREPAAVLAPYFQIPFSKNWRPWTMANVALADLAVEQAGGKKPVIAVIMASQGFLDREESLLGGIARAFLDSKCSGYFFWFDDLDEYSVSTKRLEVLKNFVNKFYDSGRPIMNMYGGFFSILLSKFGLGGFSHGVAYWERKPHRPISGGGPPLPKFYFNPVHQRLPLAECGPLLAARAYPVRDFHQSICGCDACREAIRDSVDDFAINYGEPSPRKGPRGERKYFSSRARYLCQKHYLLALSLEIQKVNQLTNEEIFEQLENAKSDFEDEIDSTDLVYLENWKEVLTR